MDSDASRTILLLGLLLRYNNKTDGDFVRRDNKILKSSLLLIQISNDMSQLLFRWGKMAIIRSSKQGNIF